MQIPVDKTDLATVSEPSCRPESMTRLQHVRAHIHLCADLCKQMRRMQNTELGTMCLTDSLRGGCFRKETPGQGQCFPGGAGRGSQLILTARSVRGGPALRGMCPRPNAEMWTPPSRLRGRGHFPIISSDYKAVLQIGGSHAAPGFLESNGPLCCPPWQQDCSIGVPTSSEPGRQGTCTPWQISHFFLTRAPRPSQ